MVIPAKVRDDALPEAIRFSTPCKHYNECGCEVSYCCMECPLPVCKYELQQGIRTVRFFQRDLYIAHLRDEGRTVKWIAQVIGISRRAVYRALAKASSERSSDAVLLTASARSATMSTAAIAVSESGESRNGR